MPHRAQRAGTCSYVLSSSSLETEKFRRSLELRVSVHACKPAVVAGGSIDSYEVADPNCFSKNIRLGFVHE